MKRSPSLEDSLGSPVSTYPPMTDDGVWSLKDGFDGEPCGEMKKRRLSAEQVRELEKSFDVENKLEPERKLKLARDLGLQPRQVAIWFQNRRARWKTKQLEREYGVLRVSYDSLKHSFKALEHDKERLVSELNQLREKLTEGGNVKNGSEVRDGSEESEGSGIDNSPNRPALISHQLTLACFAQEEASAPPPTHHLSPPTKPPPYSYHPFSKVEDEHSFMITDGPFNLFTVEQPPSFPWDLHDHWTYK
ncbi:homeobox-leucine zipper protein ATHB-16 [Amborella trichopoda]|uniref:Homeobox-leucine zipper protein n=1 Tax=Amborella trichopoda TaxID=13333 RepID=W1NU60_AMBTC|nr:homeobox-leucine zipper protein ATHB-16 [Amborella trichopoda]ERN01152.1 hypothetical protein AMTR_s00002p00215130 [Amborella trichopoda]|eukprot:XP_006838583.1 homeobox-leucine zipper protein ATHB-16 [Amborella trichopoda]